LSLQKIKVKMEPRAFNISFASVLNELMLKNLRCLSLSFMTFCSQQLLSFDRFKTLTLCRLDSFSLLSVLKPLIWDDSHKIKDIGPLFDYFEKAIIKG
jgi:hypothetical protein